MKVRSAILHSYEAGSCIRVMSGAPLDLEDDLVGRYVTSQARRSLSDLDARLGEFLPASHLGPMVADYLRDKVDMVSLSQTVATILFDQLAQMEQTPSVDVLVIDFEGKAEKPVGELDDEEVEMMYEAQAPRHLAIMLLESRQAYIHEVGPDGLGHTVASITRHHAILPNPAQKLRSFCVISATGKVRFRDEPRTIAGREVELIPEVLLECTSEPSSKQRVEEVCQIVGEVADEFGANPAEAVARAKAYVLDNVELDEVLVPEQLARSVFSEAPQVHDRFCEVAREREVPDRMAVEPQVVRRVAARHRVRTDTGIDITFPAEYGHNTDYLEFESNLDGTLSIRIKNVGSMENR